MHTIAKGLVLLVGLALGAPVSASEFCDGFRVGYQEGFCYGDAFCSTGFVPACPFQQPGEISFRHGYNRGLMMSVDKKIADRSRLAEQRRPPPPRPEYAPAPRGSSQSSMSAFAEGFNKGLRERQAREQREAELEQYRLEREEYEREQQQQNEQLARIDASLEQIAAHSRDLAERADARYRAGQPADPVVQAPASSLDELVLKVQSVVPDQKQLDADPAFMQYMEAKDPASGRTRQSLLEDAVGANDAAAVIAFYTAYKATAGSVEYGAGYAWARDFKPTFEKCITENRPEFEAGCIQYLKDQVRKAE